MWDRELAEMNRTKKTRGRKYTYPSALFYLAAFINAVLPFRQSEGFLRGLSMLKKFKVPDYTTIFRRVRKLNLS